MATHYPQNPTWRSIPRADLKAGDNLTSGLVVESAATANGCTTVRYVGFSQPETFPALSYVDIRLPR